MEPTLNEFSGLSGCHVEIVKDGPGSYVRKTTEDGLYVKRLKAQAEKQRMFFARYRLPYVQVPAILREHEAKGQYGFDMQYCRARDYLSFFQEATKQDLDTVVNRLIQFIEHAIRESPEQSIARDLLVEKYRQVREKIMGSESVSAAVRDELFNQGDRLFAEEEPFLNLPVGICHGDLTFSNILISREDCALILLDWLDCFLESPLQDIVKLRQDTKYYWSIFLMKKTSDRTRVKIIMDYLDNKIDSHFEQYAFYRKYYRLFQYLNFLRIVPYAKDPALINYIHSTMVNIVNTSSTL